MQLRPLNSVGAITTAMAPAVSALELFNYPPAIDRSRPRRTRFNSEIFSSGNSRVKAIERIALQYG